LAHGVVCLGQERIQRRVVGTGSDLFGEGGMVEPFQERVALQHAWHEQCQLGAHAEDHLAGSVLSELLGSFGRVCEVVEGVLGAVVPQLGREPDLKALVQGVLAGGHQPVEVLSADPHGVAVQVVLDDLQLAVHLVDVEHRPQVVAYQHAADVVTDASGVHMAAPWSAGQAVAYDCWVDP
jgi:hypothetical protein